MHYSLSNVFRECLVIVVVYIKQKVRSGQGAGVAIGMSRGAGDSLTCKSLLVPWFLGFGLLGFKDYWFLGFLIPELLGFFVSEFLGFFVSKFLSFKDSKISNVFRIYLFHITKFPFQY